MNRHCKIGLVKIASVKSKFVILNNFFSLLTRPCNAVIQGVMPAENEYPVFLQIRSNLIKDSLEIRGPADSIYGIYKIKIVPGNASFGFHGGTDKSCPIAVFF